MRESRKSQICRNLAILFFYRLTSGGFIVFNDPHQVVVFSSGIFCDGFSAGNFVLDACALQDLRRSSHGA
jgi:hypothetical protein